MIEARSVLTFLNAFRYVGIEFQILALDKLGGLKRSSFVSSILNPVLESGLELATFDGVGDVRIGQQIVLLTKSLFRGSL